MRLVTFYPPDLPEQSAVGVVKGGKVYTLFREFISLRQFLEQEQWLRLAREAEKRTTNGWEVEKVLLAPPVPDPKTFRDFYAFEAHVKRARASRGLEMVPEWYELPVFYYSNPTVFVGPEEKVKRPSYTQALDYELEIACIIGKEGKNIKASEAEAYIAGYTILNDWTARDAQRQEMKVGMGPAKGKDFATALGPYLVTPDELQDLKNGDRYDLAMTARVNGKEYSRGNFKDIHWTFPQMIERGSQEVTLFPGDVLGSGTVGTGCIMELGPDKYGWLKPGDVVELEIERLGILRNTVV